MYHQSELEAIVPKVQELKKTKETVLIAIDGGGGAGKSTVAKNLNMLLSNSVVVHVDDYYKSASKRVKITDDIPIHTNFEQDRLKEQVLEPLRNGLPAMYWTYNWQKDLHKPHPQKIDQGSYVIVEGLGTLGKNLSNYFDYKIWLEAPRDVRRERGLNRDTEEWEEVWDNQYLPEDDRYIKEQRPQKNADIIIES